VGFRSGLLIGALAVAVVALGVAVVILAAGGSNKSPSPTVVVAYGEACPVTESGGPAELDLSASGLDCTEGRAVQTAYERVTSTGKAGGAIEVMGWSCTSVPLSEYPTLTSCRSKDGHRLNVVGTASSAHLPHGAAHPPGTTSAESESAKTSLKPVRKSHA
jgi:hypothetical protein